MFKLLSLYSDRHRARSVFSIRRARATVEFLRRETPAFIPPDRWPTNSLDPNPVDYCIWGRVQHHVYQKPVKDVDQLKQRLIEVWSGLQQTVVDEVIDEWRRRLQACVRVKGQYCWSYLKM